MKLIGWKISARPQSQTQIHRRREESAVCFTQRQSERSQANPQKCLRCFAAGAAAPQGAGGGQIKTAPWWQFCRCGAWVILKFSKDKDVRVGIRFTLSIYLHCPI